MIGLGAWIGTLYIDQFEDLPILRFLYEYGFRSCPLHYLTVLCGQISGRYTKQSFDERNSQKVWRLDRRPKQEKGH